MTDPALPPPAHVWALRCVQPEDQAFLDHLYFTTRTDLQQLAADEATLMQLIRMQQHMQTVGQQQRFPNATHWLVTQAAQPVGRMVLNQADEGLRLVDVALLPQAQGQGLGLWLMNHLQALAQQQGCAVHLNVLHSNERARRLYQRAGFVTVSEDPLFIAMRWSPAA